MPCFPPAQYTLLLVLLEAAPAQMEGRVVSVKGDILDQINNVYKEATLHAIFCYRILNASLNMGNGQKCLKTSSIKICNSCPLQYSKAKYMYIHTKTHTHVHLHKHICTHSYIHAQINDA